MGRGRPVPCQFRPQASGILRPDPRPHLPALRRGALLHPASEAREGRRLVPPRQSDELSTDERAEVKKVARELLTRLKDLLVLNWRQKAAARSSLRLAIEDALDSGLPPAYAPEMYRQKCAAVFEHVYESYPERSAGVYAEVA